MKIFSKLLIILVIVLIVLKVLSLISLDNKNEEDALKEIKGENMCLALNYHRVRPKTMWNRLVELTTRSKELYNIQCI